MAGRSTVWRRLVCCTKTSILQQTQRELPSGVACRATDLLTRDEVVKCAETAANCKASRISTVNAIVHFNYRLIPTTVIFACDSCNPSWSSRRSVSSAECSGCWLWALMGTLGPAADLSSASLLPPPRLRRLPLLLLRFAASLAPSVAPMGPARLPVLRRTLLRRSLDSFERPLSPAVPGDGTGEYCRAPPKPARDRLKCTPSTTKLCNSAHRR